MRSTRMPVEHFEDLYAGTPDPWGYASSSYERGKYARTLEWSGRAPGRTLEIGCSIGVFSAMLAERASELLAVDFSPTALRSASERLARFPNARAECRDLPDGMPGGPFDTIVCSEVLYYWTEREVIRGVEGFERELAPGGRLLAVHWRGSDPRRSLDGDDVHRLISEHTTLKSAGSEHTEAYLLEAWEAK